jgi:hypothetical protein
VGIVRFSKEGLPMVKVVKITGRVIAIGFMLLMARAFLQPSAQSAYCAQYDESACANDGP